MDGVHENILNPFSNIYKDLYNSVNDGDKVKIINEEIESKLKANHLKDIAKVTAEEIKKLHLD